MLLNAAAALALAVLGPAAAQGGAAAAQEDVLVTRARADLAAARAQEKSAIAAIQNDAAQTPDQKATKAAAVRKDFASRRRAISDKLHADAAALRAQKLKARNARPQAPPALKPAVPRRDPSGK
jgi:hypothetical protein